MKTDGIVGKKIFAIDDGYIHRMRSDYTGYGKVLYQTTGLNSWYSVSRLFRSYLNSSSLNNFSITEYL